ncbi:SDR family oxidoreductase [Bradyrhizobium sp. 144]|uniref:SDR family NAD(P)-dependent oxidoreductase n=1 Tax=Bradyrhizobium sp. 144 TaxID=2782620 RepID=UPI001FF7CF52|nr:SDR family oxidoreductase [Bradyrhizobium sp. 144]MCK1695076.1 SDR family oxidoreductase [Bradyrhizobium sp. 144]
MTADDSRAVAIVTGGSRGIGAAASRLLAQRGWAVAVNYVAADDSAHTIVAEIIASGGRATAIKPDVTDAGAVAELFARCGAELGRLRGLVNCGSLGHARPLRRRSRCGSPAGPRGQPLRPDRVHPRNEPAHAVAERRRGGAIVNVSSGLSTSCAPNVEIHYAVSKAALNCLTLGLAQELAGEGIRVNSVSPGATRTGTPDVAVLEAAAAGIPIGRVAEPEEIGEAIAWLLSDKASYVARAYLRVGGGKPG